MPEELIYFVSDTHLGDGSGADRFRYPQQLMDLLSRIAAEPGSHLVLLGDFMELWTASMEAVLIHHAPIFDAIYRLAESHPVTYVVGNHDCLPWYYFLGLGGGAVRVTETFVAARGALVAKHGHQYDPFNQIKLLDDGQVKAPWIRKLVQVLGFLGRIGGAGTGDLIQNIGDAITETAMSLETLLPDRDEGAYRSMKDVLHKVKGILDRESPGERGYPAEERLYEEAAAGLMRQGARYVVMGHTHHPMSRQWGPRVYVNTGSWVWDRYPPTYARFAQGRLELLSGEDHEPYSPPVNL